MSNCCKRLSDTQQLSIGIRQESNHLRNPSSPEQWYGMGLMASCYRFQKTLLFNPRLFIINRSSLINHHHHHHHHHHRHHRHHHHHHASYIVTFLRSASFEH
eukprot:3438757-Amphidinium_carterae.1